MFLVKRDWLLVAALVALALSLRVGGMTGFWLNPDEGIYYGALTSSFGEFWQELRSNAHPPLYYLLLRGMGVFSVDFLWFRSLSLVFGCLVIWGTYLLGREVGGVLTGVFAAFLVAVSPAAIELSQIIRPYMFQIAALVFALFFQARYLRAGRPRDLWLYTSFMVVALLTHYSSFIVMGGAGLVLLGLLVARQLDRATVRRLVVAHIPIVVTMLALLQHLDDLRGSDLQRQAQTDWLEPHMIAEPSMIWHNFIGVMRYLFGFGYSGPTILLLLVGICVAGLRRAYLASGLPLAVLALAIVAAALQQYPFGSTRHSVYLLPILAVPIALPIAAGLYRGRRGVVLTALAAVVVLLANERIGSAIGADSYPHEAWRNRILPIRGREQILPRGDVERPRTLLDEARLLREPILMDTQTYDTLLPLFAGIEKDWQEGDFFQLPWGETRILVNKGWMMTTEEDLLDPNESFSGFLERIDAALPELDILNETQAVLVSSGWRLRLEQDLLTLDLESSSEKAIVDLAPSRTFQRDNISVFRIDLERAVEVLRH